MKKLSEIIEGETSMLQGKLSKDDQTLEFQKILGLQQILGFQQVLELQQTLELAPIQ